MGAPLPGGRRIWFGGPVIAAALFPDAYQPGGGGTGAAGPAGVEGWAGPVVVAYRGAGRVSRILRRHGVLRLWECDQLTGEPLKPKPGPVVRYERGRPGELPHMDVKKVPSIPPGGGWKAHGRGNAAGGAGWTFVHSIVDDHTRLACPEPLPDEKGTTVAAFTARAIKHFRKQGITHIAEIMTDNHWSHRPQPPVRRPTRPT